MTLDADTPLPYNCLPPFAGARLEQCGGGADVRARVRRLAHDAAGGAAAGQPDAEGHHGLLCGRSHVRGGTVA